MLVGNLKTLIEICGRNIDLYFQILTFIQQRLVAAFYIIVEMSVETFFYLFNKVANSHMYMNLDWLKLNHIKVSGGARYISNAQHPHAYVGQRGLASASVWSDIGLPDWMWWRALWWLIN